MIDLGDMWLAAPQQDLDDDDVEVGKLVIDIPDLPDKSDNTSEVEASHYTNTELRGEPPVTEETCRSTHIETNPTDIKPQKVLPLRISRDVPIKLLLKRSFQTSRKPHKERLKNYKTYNEKNNLNESIENNKLELLQTHESALNQVETLETIEKNVVTNEGNHRVTHETMTYVFPKALNVSHGSINSHKEELLPTHKQHLIQVGAQERIDRKNTVANHVYQRVSPQNDFKITTPAVPSKKQNTRNESIKRHKQDLLDAYKHYLDQVEKVKEPIVEVKKKWKSRTKANIGISTPNNYSNNETFAMYSQQQKILNSPTELLRRELMSAHKNYSLKLKQEASVGVNTIKDDVDQRGSPQNNKENKVKKTTSDARDSSSPDQSLSSRQHENTQRISVVSNDFLFKQCNKRETLGKPNGINSQSGIDNDPSSCSPMCLEAYTEFLKRQYQLALTDNIPLTVNRMPLYQDSLQEISDSRNDEVMNIGQTTPQPQQHQPSTNVINQNLKGTPVAEQNSTNQDNLPGYNILVHRGPDVNRIVITLADEKEENNKNTNHQSYCGDQRVPDSLNTPTYPEAGMASQRKRSYYYKEPSLRSFRRRYSHQRAQKQIKNTEMNGFDPTDYLPLGNQKHKPFAQHYSYVGNHYDLPTPVLENYCTIGAYNYFNPVTHGLFPWEVCDRGPFVSDQTSKRAVDVLRSYSSQKQHQLASHEQLLGPLNLSLKPLAVDQRLP